MKKYIRTKDGRIIDSLALRIDEFVYLDEKGLPHREYRTTDPLKKVVKVADTIEELCDEFVIKMSKEHYVSKRSLMELRDMNNYVGCIYGAIWTDKGLIYVAKMNEKGELELL